MVVVESVTMATASRSDNNYEGGGWDVDGSGVQHGTAIAVQDYMERGYFCPFTYGLSACCCDFVCRLLCFKKSKGGNTQSRHNMTICYE